jgi:hypothetical protein
MLNIKIENKNKLKKFYKERYRRLNKNQLEILIHQFSYNVSLAYINNQGHIR